VARRTLAQADGFAVVDTLTFLQRGGRISNAQWLFGTALQLKPVLGMVGGLLVPVARVRTSRRALQRMLDLAAARIDGRGPVSLAVMHANAPRRAQALLDVAAAQLHPAETFLTNIGPTIGTHAGPGALGLCFQYGDVGLPAGGEAA
jgi:DegV family protein with EDD domain